MHDYDRRPSTTASSKTTEVEDSYWPLELDKIVSHGLRDHNARLDDYKARAIDDHNVEVTGTIVDGRTFRAEVYVFLKGGIRTRTKIVVEGTVDMGPLPPVLERVEAGVVKLLAALASAGLDRLVYRNLAHGWAITAELIELWRRGDPVDPKELRSRLNNQVKDIKMLTDHMRNHAAYPQLVELIEETRKACGAAARGIPDIG